MIWPLNAKLTSMNSALLIYHILRIFTKDNPITRAWNVLCLTTTLAFCSATSQEHQQQICNSLLIPLSSFSLCLSLFPRAILWVFFIPLLCDSCSCFIPPLLLFQSLVTSNLSFSLSLWTCDLHLLWSSCSVIFYRSSCHGNFSLSHSIRWFFCGIFIPPSFHPSSCSLSSPSLSSLSLSR